MSYYFLFLNLFSYMMVINHSFQSNDLKSEKGQIWRTLFTFHPQLLSPVFVSFHCGGKHSNLLLGFYYMTLSPSSSSGRNIWSIKQIEYRANVTIAPVTYP